MIKCARCKLPETYETIEFDADGICNICRQSEFKKDEIDWASRHSLLVDLVEEHRGKHAYDCLIPFSGGKDSSFTLWYAVRKLGLKPLVVQFNHGFMRPNLLKNNEKTFKELGVDVLSFTPNWKIVKLLMKESFLRKGDFCWHCHTGIFSYPMHVALLHRVPLIFWGEPSSEYTAYYDYRSNSVERVDERRFNRFINLGLTADDMREIISSHTDVDPRDFAPYSYPDATELDELGYQSVALGSFIPWDTRNQSEIIQRELGWEGDEVEGMPPGIWPYEKIECFMQGSRDYIKYLKRGYGRVSQMVALDLRNSRIQPDEAARLVDEFEGSRPASLDILLEYLDMSEEEFNSVVEEMAIFPHKPFFENIPIGAPTHDFGTWFRESK